MGRTNTRQLFQGWIDTIRIQAKVLDGLLSPIRIETAPLSEAR